MICLLFYWLFMFCLHVSGCNSSSLDSVQQRRLLICMSSPRLRSLAWVPPRRCVRWVRQYPLTWPSWQKVHRFNLAVKQYLFVTKNFCGHILVVFTNFVIHSSFAQITNCYPTVRTHWACYLIVDPNTRTWLNRFCIYSYKLTFHEITVPRRLFVTALQ